ncbi:hypothetical protein OIU79_009123 [Salix purpurea]|uniref:acetyl-CoA C-acyltransferase n=1 Tax=Salix purpurea TaxID=77065 RepID=A0A9Q0TK46_SALPP|nr:hypothetical protein OIU79_009123 [Salix purpurea]
MGFRPNTSLADLGKLKAVFKKDGTTTAGNSSQVSDGAAAVLLMKRSVAMRKGLPILGVFRAFVVVGVDPATMGVGPAVAIPAAVKAAGLDLEDIDLFEINEAFASQFVYCCKKLELDLQKINVNGGAIAIGHPLGTTGARCVATLLHEMKRRGRDCRFGVVSMCIGTGMGAAAVFESGDGSDELCNAGKSTSSIITVIANFSSLSNATLEFQEITNAVLNRCACIYLISEEIFELVKKCPNSLGLATGMIRARLGLLLTSQGHTVPSYSPCICSGKRIAGVGELRFRVFTSQPIPRRYSAGTQAQETGGWESKTMPANLCF